MFWNEDGIRIQTSALPLGLRGHVDSKDRRDSVTKTAYSPEMSRESLRVTREESALVRTAFPSGAAA